MSTTDISTDQFYRFDIVTDPDDPSVTDSLAELLSLIENNDKIVTTETNLDRGLIRYTIDIVYDSDNNPDLVHSIEQLVGNISYVPITVSLDLSLFNNYDNIGPVINGSSEIIKVLTESIIDTDVNNVEEARFNDVLIYTPITSYKTAVYENPLYLAEYHRILNLNYIGGRQVLSSDPIVRYVLSDLYKKKEYVPADIDVIYVNGIALIPVGTNDNEVNHYMNIKDRISTIITTRRKDCYFSYSLGIHNIEDNQLVHEIASLWNTEVVYSDDIDLIILKTDSDFGIQPELWFQYNIDLVKRGQFPSITIYGLWQFKIGGDYNQIYGKNWYAAILHYAALLAYKKLGEEDPFIQPFTHTVKVNNDYSITLSLPTYNHVITFKKYLDEILYGFRGMEHQGQQSWYAEPCKDLMDGVVKRYYVQSIDPRSMPMVIPNVYEDGKIEQVLVFRSPALSIYTPDSPFDFDKVDMDNIKQELVNDLKQYYGLCHDKFEPVLRDKINDMDLDDLLSLVEVKERPDQPTYCFSKDTILNLTHPINPLTRRPFTEQIIVKAMLIEWGLRGIFNVGPLIGMYEDIPRRKSISPTVGSPLFDKLKIDDMLHSITGDIYSVEIGFQDGIISPLFEIATSSRKELETLVNDLWKHGFFLNYWTSSLEKYSDNLTSYSVITSNPLLLHGADSKVDGERAMNYLRESGFHYLEDPSN